MRFAAPALPENGLLRLYGMIPHGRDWMQILFHIQIAQLWTGDGLVSLSKEKGEVMCWFWRFLPSCPFLPQLGSLSSFDREDSFPPRSPTPGPSTHAFPGLPSKTMGSTGRRLGPWRKRDAWVFPSLFLYLGGISGTACFFSDSTTPGQPHHESTFCQDSSDPRFQ